ncbi:hypothetical protein Fmac_018189 [Flemingia macrophylla]|uniref:Uncharacterized protein n=1 Tax=Flemingia macrophylla TaxID=520843 RepID=A0ABD1M493_9FABA
MEIDLSIGNREYWSILGSTECHSKFDDKNLWNFSEVLIPGLYQECEVGQKYEPHDDYFLDEFNTKNGSQRIATVLMYLLAVILFPNYVNYLRKFS